MKGCGWQQSFERATLENQHGSLGLVLDGLHTPFFCCQSATFMVFAFISTGACLVLSDINECVVRQSLFKTALEILSKWRRWAKRCRNVRTAVGDLTSSTAHFHSEKSLVDLNVTVVTGVRTFFARTYFLYVRPVVCGAHTVLISPRDCSSRYLQGVPAGTKVTTVASC